MSAETDACQVCPPHPKHDGEECQEEVDYDHLNGSHECGCPGLTAEVIVERVIDLWNRSRGWIPGANYQLLAEALGVDESRLWHWDPELKTHVLDGVPVTEHHGARLL